MLALNTEFVRQIMKLIYKDKSLLLAKEELIKTTS